MNLLETFDSLLASWQAVFSQQRMFERARRLTFGLLSWGSKMLYRQPASLICTDLAELSHLGTSDPVKCFGIIRGC